MADWHIDARYYEACNCAVGCPCNFTGFPTTGRCEGVIAFDVVAGDREGVDLSGSKVVAVAAWPGAIHEGNGTMVVYMDGSDAQCEALGAILSGQDGGLPFEIIAATMATVEGPFRQPITIDDQAAASRIRVGDEVAIDLEALRNPVTGEEHEAHTVLPNGFIFTDALVCTTSRFEVRAGSLELAHPGGNGYYSRQVRWSNAA